MTFDIGLTAIGGTVLLLGLLSVPVRRLWLSGPLLALLLGVLLGPEVSGLLTPAEWGEESYLLEQAARLTVAMSLMAIALRLPPGYLYTHMRSLLIVLGPVMIAMWVVSGLATHLILAVPIWVALLVGAVITPTDPVISSTIVQGSIAKRNLPERMRHFLSAEAGANDVLSYPLVFLAVLMLAHPPGAALEEWLVRVLLWEVLAVVALGGVLGYLAGRALSWADRSALVPRTSYLVFSLSLTITVLGITELARTNGLLGVFVAGLVFRGVISEQEERDEENVQDAVNDFFLLPVFVLLGLTLPWSEWAALGWRGPVLVVAVLLLRRLPVFVALSPFMRSVHGMREAAFLGWFGPIGVAALFYANLSLHETSNSLVWTVGSLVICASVLVHGVTATPITRLFGRRAGRAANDREHSIA
ncbi:NhaP-type Na+/H+ or K+/H+ antiporter [Lipingzhangella halophila]|uniref:NhaP-type Na+/H+ or K+/H+ antiporter n=1 Tax=Lipingzhangella halophila TaxID=1783352 RepID=A0A7W7RPB2_9ACTN|nr:cation:proton antiporter [Lipingzhangella halophila]MBB4935631.1 NhaP-type Na+/H+ or K+/H+ antiporter [Lipingzhangella halophila]